MATPAETIRWTVTDLELLPEDGRRYEVIDGELFVTSPILPGFRAVVGQFF